jgi:hypothetical protein
MPDFLHLIADVFTTVENALLPPPNQPKPPAALNTAVQLTLGQLYYYDVQHKLQMCGFQFNPTELERSRDINYTRSRTGNINEERGDLGRDALKRKQTRKPEPWVMSLTLRFDAAYGKLLGSQPSPPPIGFPVPATPGGSRFNANAPYDPVTAGYRDELDRIEDTIHFFEKMVEPVPFEKENEQMANADETPPPPYVWLALGPRAWQCAVRSVRIKEDDYTITMRPRRFEVTLNLEIIIIIPQNLNQQWSARSSPPNQ